MTSQLFPVQDSARPTRSATSPGGCAATPGATGRRAERRGWCAVAAITAAVAVTWAPRLNAPFGDNHLGRIIGRYALHLGNLHERGVLGSHFSADWVPYAFTPYAHHPPLLNLLTALAGTLPGDGEYQVWLPPYLLALLVIPAAAALLRGFELRWSATLLAVGLMVATTFYWVYSPVMFDLGPILALSAAVVRLRRQPVPPRWLVVSAGVAALLTTLVSWPGIVFAAALGLWLFTARRVDRVTILVGAMMVTGVAISLVFIVGVTGLSRLSDQTELRTSGGDYTVTQFLRQQWRYARTLLPTWYLLGLPAGVAAGLLDRRTRHYTAVATTFTAGWILALNNGAYVHSYWSYPVLILGLVGMGVLLDRLADRLAGTPAGHRAERRTTRLTAAVRATGRPAVAGALAGMALAAYLGMLVLGPTQRRHLAEPARAGRLVAEHRPPAGQQYAWMVGTGLTTPRWLTYYWGLTPRSLTAEGLLADGTRPDDLVLMDLRRRPEWLAESIGQRAVTRDGPYALFRLADLRTAIS